MRYYAIRITDPKTGEILLPNLNGKPGFTRQPDNPQLNTYTSLINGASPTTVGGTNFAAQTIEIDLPITFLHEPVPGAYVRVWGISLSEIGQASDLQGLNIAIYGVMAKGLPLANPAQSGLLASGQIYQSFGNWVNTDMTLDIYVFFAGSSPTSNQTTGNPSSVTTAPLPSTNNAPANLTFQWSSGQNFLTSVANSLLSVFPKYKIQGAVNPNLIWTGPSETGFFATITQFAQYLNQLSQKIIGGSAPNTQTYAGVSLTLQNNTISIGDGTTQTNPKQIQFIDLVGQPTWSQPFQVQITCIMRADVNVGDYIKLPATPGITQSGSASQFFNPSQGNQFSTAKSGSIFSGTFQITAIRHVGNFRNPAAQSWVTTLDLLLVTNPTSTVASLPVIYKGNSNYSFYLPK